MNIFEDKEQVRAVYKFSKDDPIFDKFYDCLCLLAEEKYVDAVIGFGELISMEGVKNPYVYRYALVSMIQNKSNNPELLSMATAWNARAAEFGDARELTVSSFALELFKTVDEGKMTLEEALKDRLKTVLKVDADRDNEMQKRIA